MTKTELLLTMKEQSTLPLKIGISILSNPSYFIISKFIVQLHLPDIHPFFSHVHASYAGFLWETEEDNDECDAPSELDSNTLQIGHAAVASANA